MCVLTTTAIAGGLAAIGATTMASSATAVGLTTLAANAVIGAGLSAGIGAASGQRGSDLWRTAAIGAAGAGVGSALGMAVGGISTATEVATTLTPAQQLAMGATDVAPGMLNEGAEVAALMNNPALVSGAEALPQTTQIAGHTPGLVAMGGAAAAGSASNLEDSMMKLSGAAIQAGAGAVEGYGAYQQGKDDAATLKAQARDEELRAQQEIEAAEIEAKDLARRQKHAVGAGKAAAAAGGVMLEGRAESAPSVWEQDMAAEIAWDREKLFYNANQRANIRYFNAGQMRIGAKNARRGGNLKAATSVIKGLAGMAVSAYGRPSATLYA